MYSRAMASMRSSRPGPFRGRDPARRAGRRLRARRRGPSGRHDLLEGGILLSDDVVETGRFDSGLVELLIRSARLDGLVLTHVADEQDPVVGFEAARGTRASVGCSPDSIRRARRDACGRRFPHPLAHRCRWSVVDGMPASPSCWAAREVGREPFDGVSRALGSVADRRQRRRLSRAGDAFERLDLIAAREDLLDGRPLGLGQVRMVVHARPGACPGGTSGGCVSWPARILSIVSRSNWIISGVVNARPAAPGRCGRRR